MSDHLVPIPENWIGIRKDWLDTCESLGEALVSIPQEAKRIHLYSIGSSGSGKSTLLHHLAAQDLLASHSILVLDARGDMVKAVLELAARAKVHSSQIRLIDLREKSNPTGFNPLAGAGEAYYRALGLLNAVAAEWESLGPQTAEAMRNAILLLAEVKAPITQLEPLFYDQQVRQGYLRGSVSDRVRDFWTRYDSLSPDRQANFASPVLNKLNLLFATDGLRRMFGHPHPINLAEHLDTPGSILLVSLAVDELHGAGWMTGSILLSCICREIFARVEVAESMRNPVRLYVDEFEHFGMREFENLLAEGRRFKCSLVLAHQTLAQLSPKMRSMILGNVGVKVVFRTASQDADILCKDLVGNTKGLALASLGVGEAVLWRRGEAPVEFEANSPLIQDVGDLSPAALQLLNAIKADIPKFEQPNDQRTESAANESSSLDDVPGPNLEDWL